MQLTFDAFNEDQPRAVFDASLRYRYTLWRQWDPRGPIVNFIMLNPSTADAMQNDPTVTRCIHYAQKWGFGSLVVTNIFAYRSTDPKALTQVVDPIGPENNDYLRQIAEQAQQIVLAWGTHGVLAQRHAAVLALLHPLPLSSLAITKDGYPQHPLYLPGHLTPQPYVPHLL